jgi:hypothetical protein
MGKRSPSLELLFHRVVSIRFELLRPRRILNGYWPALNTRDTPSKDSLGEWNHTGSLGLSLRRERRGLGRHGTGPKRGIQMTRVNATNAVHDQKGSTKRLKRVRDCLVKSLDPFYARQRLSGSGRFRI